MGTLWNRSGTIERYGDDIRAAGAKAYFYVGGTTTPMGGGGSPQNVYKNSSETSAFPLGVVEADAQGRWPDVYVPYVISYDVRVTTAQGAELTYSTRIPNPNPAGGSTVVPTAGASIETGMIIAMFVTNASKPGYVRLNGGSLGNAQSAANATNAGLSVELAHDSDPENAPALDPLPLYIHLYTNLDNTLAPVIGGRSGSGHTANEAQTDFGNNKPITLPDLRGRMLIGADELGGAAKGMFPFPAVSFDTGGNATAGSTTGINAFKLLPQYIPAHNHAVNLTPGGDGAHSHSYSGANNTLGAIQTHHHTWGGSFTTGDPSISLDHKHLYDKVSVTAVSGITQAGTTQTVTTAQAATTGISETPSNDAMLPHKHTFAVGGDTSTVVGGNITSVYGDTFTNGDHGHYFSWSGTTPTSEGGHTHSIGLGDGSPALLGKDFNNLPRCMICMWYMKL